MTPEQENKLNDVYAAVTEIKTAIVGHKDLGIKGIISRMQDLETYKEKDHKFKTKIIGWVTGAVAVTTPIVIIIWELFKYKNS